jgi:hypothetical protein
MENWVQLLLMESCEIRYAESVLKGTPECTPDCKIRNDISDNLLLVVSSELHHHEHLHTMARQLLIHFITKCKYYSIECIKNDRSRRETRWLEIDNLINAYKNAAAQ